MIKKPMLAVILFVVGCTNVSSNEPIVSKDPAQCFDNHFNYYYKECLLKTPRHQKDCKVVGAHLARRKCFKV